MIVVRIEGGLGNQMFQYAFGTQIAHRNRTELVLDLSSYAKKPQHGYLLDRWQIAARQLEPHEVRRLPHRYQPKANRSVWRRFFLPIDGLKRVREKPFGFSKEYLETRNDCYLVGYWQSERYFPDVTKEVVQQFQPRTASSHQSERIRERMLETNSIAIHIRRGDYLNPANPQFTACNLSLEYYYQSILHRLRHRVGCEAFVFSNDIAWCREKLRLPCPTHYVEHTTNGTAHEDLWMMTAAESLVIANSTFSWWGAYLGQRDGKTVYAPMQWFRPNTLDDSNIPCQSWIQQMDPVSTRLAA